MPTRTQLFTVPPEGERPNLTRRLVVIDETLRPTTALCEFVDATREQAGGQDAGVATASAAAAEGPEPKVDLKANRDQDQREKSQWRPAAAADTMPFSPSSSSLGPENQLFKSASPFSPMQTHSRSQLSLQLSAVANRPPEPDTLDSPTLVVIDPSVEAILNERRPRSPSAPGTPTNSSQVSRPRHNRTGTDKDLMNETNELLTRNIQFQRGTTASSTTDAVRVAHMRQIQKQKTRENFLFGTAAEIPDAATASEETPKAESAHDDAPDDLPVEYSGRHEGGAPTAAASSPITASASSSSLLSRIVRPRIRLPAIPSSAQ